MTHHGLYITREQAKAILYGAQNSALLAAVEHAFMVGDDVEVHTLLSPVDPIDARHTANILKSLWQVWSALPDEVRGGTTGVTKGPRGPLPLDASARDRPLDREPSAPIKVCVYCGGADHPMECGMPEKGRVPGISAHTSALTDAPTPTSLDAWRVPCV